MYAYLYITKKIRFIQLFQNKNYYPFHKGLYQKTQHVEFATHNKSFFFVKWCMFQFMIDLISFHRIFCDVRQLRLSEQYEMQPSILNPAWKKICFVSGSVWCEWQKCILPCRPLILFVIFADFLWSIFRLHYNQK